MNSKKKESKGPYATFRSSGIEVDLTRFFTTPEGIGAWNKVSRIKQKDLELAKKIFHDILMEEDAERIKSTLNELIEVAQEIIAEFDQRIQNRTLHDEMGFGEVNELKNDLDNVVETLRDVQSTLPWNWTNPEFDPEMISSIFSAVEIMEEANAPFFVRWYRKARRALDKLTRKP